MKKIMKTTEKNARGVIFFEKRCATTAALVKSGKTKKQLKNGVLQKLR